MELILLRHGKTAGNLARRYIGKTDEPLCDSGKQALAAKGQSKVLQKVYVSPLLRAKQTAHILFPNAQQVEIADLREMNFGIFEGKNADEMIDDPAYTEWVNNTCASPCPEGESQQYFIQRTSKAFQKLITTASNVQESLVVIVAHGGTLMALMSQYADSEKSYFDWQTSCGEGWRVWLNEGDFHKNPCFTAYEPLKNVTL